MEKTKYITTIQNLVQNKNLCGLETYVIIKDPDGKLQYHFFELKQKICEKILNQFVLELDLKFNKNDFSLKDINSVADNQKDTYYVFSGDSIFQEISFLSKENLNGNKNTKFKLSKEQKILGFIFKLGNDETEVLLYQHFYPTSQIKVGKTIVLTEIPDSDDITMASCDLLRINKSIDMIKIDKEIITSNIKLLERCFNFNKVIESTAKPAIDFLENCALLSDFDKFKKYVYNPKKLSKLKKLMSADSSILSMKKTELLEAVKNHRRYGRLIKIENNEIVIKNNNDIDNVIMLLSDGVLTSTITNFDYSVDVKEKFVDNSGNPFTN